MSQMALISVTGRSRRVPLGDLRGSSRNRGGVMKMRPRKTRIRTTAALALLAGWGTSAGAIGQQHELTSGTHKELAVARAATAKYHDVAQAEADGYVNIDLYECQGGFIWVN